MESTLKPLNLWDMRGAPIGSAVSRNLPGVVPYMATFGQCSQALVDKGPKNERLAALFLERLQIACERAKSVSLLLFFARGYVYDEIVPVKSRVKTTINEFAKIFPNVEENALYVVHKDYGKR